MSLNNNDPIDVKFRHWLTLLKGVQDCGEYHKALCPAHDDNQNSLSTRIGEEGIVANCHAGCTFPAICHSAGVPASWMFNPKPEKTEKMVASWIYCDEIGAQLFRTCRFEDGTIGENGKPKKTFRQQQPTKDGKSWKNGVKDVRQVPYRLPDIVMSSGLVLIVEGEKQADRLAELGYVATCNAGGAGKWRAEFSEHLRGRDVVILPDNDQAGRDHARDVTKKLDGAAASVRVAILPDLPEKGDIIDWLDAGGTADQLQELIESAGGIESLVDPPPPQFDNSLADDPVATASDRDICDALGIFVYGEDETGKIKVFSKAHRKTQFIRDVNKFYMADFLRLCGPIARQVVYIGEDDKPENTWRIGEVRNAIATLAGYRRVTERSELGVGAWLCHGENRDRDSVVLVNAGEAAILNGEPGLNRHLTPDYGGQLLDLSESDPWFDHATISDYVTRGEAWRTSVVEELEAIYGLWKFRDQDVTPAILTGLTLATWIQSIWDWRPQVSISGKSGSGKTTLFGFLAGKDAGEYGIFGRLAVKSSHSSAAGLRQAVSNTSRILICDEMEAGRHRGDIYEMLRNAGRGDRTLRGTAGQKATAFSLRHLVWVAATESGLTKEPDKNRFISIELMKPPEVEIGELVDKLPFPEDCQSLGQKLLAVAVATARDAKSLATRLRQSKPRGLDHRVIESYAVPAAAYSAAMGLGEGESLEVFHRMLSAIDEGVIDIRGDEERLVEAILGSIVDLGHGERMSVAECIDRSDYTVKGVDADASMQRCGLKLVRDPDPRETWIDGEYQCLFVHATTVTRHLLRGTEWEGKDITQFLKRIEGAVQARKVIHGTYPRGILIPIDRFLSKE